MSLRTRPCSAGNSHGLALAALKKLGQYRCISKVILTMGGHGLGWVGLDRVCENLTQPIIEWVEINSTQHNS